MRSSLQLHPRDRRRSGDLSHPRPVQAQDCRRPRRAATRASGRRVAEAVRRRQRHRLGERVARVLRLRETSSFRQSGSMSASAGQRRPSWYRRTAKVVEDVLANAPTHASGVEVGLSVSCALNLTSATPVAWPLITQTSQLAVLASRIGRCSTLVPHGAGSVTCGVSLRRLRSRHSATSMVEEVPAILEFLDVVGSDLRSPAS
jgi:hypothetical protein